MPLRDILMMRANGDLLNTQVLNKTFTIKTVFGNVTAKTSQIVRITMEGAGLPDELITNSADILKGTIQDKSLSARIFTGEVVKFRLPKDILSIQFLDNLHPSLRKKLRRGRRRRKG